MEFCKQFNAATQKNGGHDHSRRDHCLQGQDFHVHHQVAACQRLAQEVAAGIATASAEPNRNKVGKVTRKQVLEIAKTKMADLNAGICEDAACRVIARHGAQHGNRRGRLAEIEVFMATHGKRYNEAIKQVDAKRQYKIARRGGTAQEVAVKTKFDEPVELAFKLGVDAKQSDQMVRGTVALPHGSGKKVRVVVFAKGGAAQAAKDFAGADFVGFEDLVKKCQEGWTDFDVAVATPKPCRKYANSARCSGRKRSDAQPEGRARSRTIPPARRSRKSKAGRGRIQDGQSREPARFIRKTFVRGSKAIEENARAVITRGDARETAYGKGAFLSRAAPFRARWARASRSIITSLPRATEVEGHGFS